MDGRRFDNWTRSLSNQSSRRSVLRSVAGAATGALAALIRNGTSAAPANPCPGGHLCSGDCCDGGFEACCNGACVEIKVDVNHCDGCGKTCPEGQICCGGTCTHPLSDKNNCGACGNRCQKGGTCDGGKCRCPAGKTVCDGRCVDLEKNADHCGTCGRSCGQEAHCEGGQCVCKTAGGCVCASGKLSCGDVCCAKHHVCKNGTCACKDDQLDCGNICTPKSVDGGVIQWQGCCTDDDCPKQAICRDHACLECDPSAGLHCPNGQVCCDTFCVALGPDECGCRSAKCQTGWFCLRDTADDPGRCCTFEGLSLVCKSQAVV
jgi:hypothetical protein